MVFVVTLRTYPRWQVARCHGPRLLTKVSKVTKITKTNMVLVIFVTLVTFVMSRGPVQPLGVSTVLVVASDSGNSDGWSGSAKTASKSPGVKARARRAANVSRRTRT